MHDCLVSLITPNMQIEMLYVGVEYGIAIGTRTLLHANYMVSVCVIII